MPPRPAPDLQHRRQLTLQAARETAEAEGWEAVTMRALAARLGMTQPALYTAFEGRQAIVDAVALQGFEDLATALEAAEATPQARSGAYLSFAEQHPRVYDAMFGLPSNLAFASPADSPASMWRAFEAIRSVFPNADETTAEIAWATFHGLATLQAAGRLRPTHLTDRLDLIHHLFGPKEAR